MFHSFKITNYRFFTSLLFILLPFAYINIDSFFLIIFILFIAYILSVYSITIYTIEHDSLVVTYPTRIFKRNKIVNYKEVEVVLYTYARYQPPVIAFLTDSRKRFSESNSFACRSYKKRKEILLFLKSKGLEIENRCTSMKDRNILD